MIHKTRGIVFRFTKYGETSIIVTIFTEAFGLQSYMVNGVRSKSAKNKIALYQPLTLLNLVVYHRENANIERIKEVQCLYPYNTVTTDVRKSAIALFISELLNKSVKDESHAEELFRFISDSLIALDEMPARFENFHLIFMLRLSRYLGFGAYNNNEILGVRITDEATEIVLSQLLSCTYDAPLSITNAQRRNLLELILKFYSDHLGTTGEMKSLQVLRDVLN
jgi:DNA repair protein RecO (recombination protein O)